ncbi:MAG: nitroreductase [Nitrospirae bacterium RBG_13_39_12]|nr:MAG: nitroreductase [Nitrospirae bacterium RBG_13_39_12]
MLKTKEAIEKRRSIRKFKPDSIPDEHIYELLNAARLAPSGCNAQPWRFKIVKDKEVKLRLAEAANNQMFIANAPVVLVCCADIKGYLNSSVSYIQDLGKNGSIEERIIKILLERTEKQKTLNMEQISPRIAFNVAIAVEHIILRALDFGLGTCWVRLINEKMIREMFGWDSNIHVVALLPIGYPDELPKKRKRLEIKDILID